MVVGTKMAQSHKQQALKTISLHTFWGPGRYLMLGRALQVTLYLFGHLEPDFGDPAPPHREPVESVPEPTPAPAPAPAEEAQELMGLFL